MSNGKRYTAQDMRETADDLENYSDMDESVIADMLRQAADMMESEERERKYEYACFNRTFQTLEGARIYATANEIQWRRPTIVRREVGEWEEV